MIDEFDLPKDIVDRQVRKMTMISPTNKEVQIGQTLKEHIQTIHYIAAPPFGCFLGFRNSSHQSPGGALLQPIKDTIANNVCSGGQALSLHGPRCATLA